MKSPDGRVGVVEAVSLTPEGAPFGLLVRTGLFGNRVLSVPAKDVARIVPQKQVILLASDPLRRNATVTGDLADRLRDIKRRAARR